MAAGRRRLTRIVCAAAAAVKRGRSSLLCNSDHCPSSSTSQCRFFSSWLESNVSCYDPPAKPCLSTAALLPYSFSSGSPTEYLDLAPTSTPSPCKHHVSRSPFTSQFLYCPEIGLPGLLCISDDKSAKQIHVLEPSTKGELCPRAGTQKNDAPSKEQSFWSSQEVVNWPNAISFGRLLSGPVLAWLIMEGLLQPALVGLIIAGASDWLDGYIARKQGIDSVFGTYLDPLADKVLIGFVAFSMAQAGYLPLALVALVIARDAALIGGSLVISAHKLKSQVTSLWDIFKMTKESTQKVEPLYISKINTVFQLALLVCHLHNMHIIHGLWMEAVAKVTLMWFYEGYIASGGNGNGYGNDEALMCTNGSPESGMWQVCYSVVEMRQGILQVTEQLQFLSQTHLWLITLKKKRSLA